MIAICVENREKSFIADYMIEGNYYSLPVFNKNLIELQLENFINFDFKKIIYLCENYDNTFSKFCKIGIFDIFFMDKEELLLYLLSQSKTEKAVVFKSDVYFEINKLPDVSEVENTNERIAFGTDEQACFCFITGVESIINKTATLKKPVDIFSGVSADKYLKTSYSKTLNTHIAYKELVFDVLKSRTLFKPPLVAEGIFAQGKLPQGDFTIIPPVYFGEGVQIESGTIIGPDVVLYDNVLVAGNTCIRKTVLFNDVYVSSGCFIDGGVCLCNATVKRNGAVFKNSLLGENAVVGEDVMVECSSQIKPDVKIEKYYKLPFYEGYEFLGLKNLSPERAALLGGALGAVYGSPSIGLASDGSPNALAVKLALISGLMSTGADCTDFGVSYNSRIFYSAEFCGLKYSVFISGGKQGTGVKIYENMNPALTKADVFNLFSVIKSKKIKYCSYEACRPVHQIKGLSKMYQREICGMFNEPLRVKPVFRTDEKFINKATDDIVEKIGVNEDYSYEIAFNINSTGTKASARVGSDSIPYKKLLMLAYFCSQGDSINERGALKNLWRYDGVFLAFYILSIVEKSRLSLLELADNLPSFFVLRKEVLKNITGGELARKFTDFQEVVFKKNSLIIRDNGSKAALKFSDNTHNLRLLSSSVNEAAAEDFMKRIETLLLT